jgi:hypothetical protein
MSKHQYTVRIAFTVDKSNRTEAKNFTWDIINYLIDNTYITNADIEAIDEYIDVDEPDKDYNPGFQGFNNYPGHAL